MDLLKGKAYGIFVAELAKHLARAHEVFDREQSPTSEQVYLAMTSFHTIKGGAGFFGLSEIARVAGHLESLLQKDDLDLALELSGIRDSIASLEKLAKRMPDPVPQ